ncbi:glycosyltransferase family 2 protein [Synechococcus sp. CS-1328]|uniref:glycosyltransferase family 2 protein n=1 Tax=Synechococcus sp. CS-1328 TaxID=2847976 RepID=UPI00223BBB77|nr:glycosyltransferase family 2 protein [Synechococcus sp. CS-1328]MCT0225925.1 glycosyltransferase family 2 protein [Synechococcus sp. CS-1328]
MPDPLDQITPLILTFNEEANIGRTLEGLRWAQRIVVVDSGSTDATLTILADFPQVEVVTRAFDSFARQANFGLGLINTPWCLSLDADHGITAAFRIELAHLIADVEPEVDAVRTPFRYLVYGRPLRSSLLPPRINLMRPASGTYVDDGHAHRFVPQGHVIALHEPVLHDDRKPLDRWLDSQRRYLHLEVQKLLSTPQQQLSRADRLRKRHLIAPFAVLLLCLVWHRGLLDGWRGWFYAFQRTYVELLFSLILWEARQDG